MISAWQIYLVMQLDSINRVVTSFSVLCFMFGAFCSLWCFFNSEDDNWSWNEGKKEEREKARKPIIKRASRFFISSALLAALASLLPSTKTAAAMIVLPAIINNESVQREAGELYRIAKDALRSISNDKPKEADSE